SLGRQPIVGFAPPVIHAMMNYSWKGNIREMENLIKRAIIKSETTSISAIELPSMNSSTNEEPAANALDTPSTTALPYKSYLENVIRDAEAKYIIRVLQECKGNLNQVARVMDVDRKTVYRKIEEYQIDVTRFKG